MNIVIYIVLYFLFLLGAYILIIQRIKVLSRKHKENTGIETLKNGYKIVRRRMVALIIVLFFIGSFILLTSIDNDILQETGLYNDQKTLDNNAF